MYRKHLGQCYHAIQTCMLVCSEPSPARSGRCHVQYPSSTIVHSTPNINMSWHWPHDTSLSCHSDHHRRRRHHHYHHEDHAPSLVHRNKYSNKNPSDHKIRTLPNPATKQHNPAGFCIPERLCITCITSRPTIRQHRSNLCTICVLFWSNRYSMI